MVETGCHYQQEGSKERREKKEVGRSASHVTGIQQLIHNITIITSMLISIFPPLTRRKSNSYRLVSLDIHSSSSTTYSNANVLLLLNTARESLALRSRCCCCTRRRHFRSLLMERLPHSRPTLYAVSVCNIYRGILFRQCCLYIQSAI